jgi:thiosulfate/3-mercaptopyruvate sulfurtransferase
MRAGRFDGRRLVTRPPLGTGLRRAFGAGSVGVDTESVLVFKPFFFGDDTMKTRKTFLWMTVLSLALPTVLRAAEPASKPQVPPLLSFDALQQRLSDPSLRPLDVRSREKYDKGHIPGAIWVDLKALQALSRSETFADKDAWARGLASLAIDKESEVYVYDDDRQHNAGRVWWLLSYAGAPQVGLIGGGFPLWEREKRPVNAEIPRIEPQEFAVQFHPRRAVSREEVRSSLAEGKVQLVDARSSAEYRGERKPENGGRAGHIPSARLLDLFTLVDTEGRFLSADAQREQLVKAGIAPDQPIIVYSQGGSRSGGVVFALRRLGIPTRHYFGGFNDWVSDESAPIEEGAGSARRAD